MKYKNDTYTFGQCSKCKYDRALKNGVCAECDKKPRESRGGGESMPDFLKDIFGDVF